MVEQVTSWRASDGTLHETEHLAHLAEDTHKKHKAKENLKELLLSFVDTNLDGDREVDWAWLKDQRDDLVDALYKWDPD